MRIRGQRQVNTGTILGLLLSTTTALGVIACSSKSDAPSTALGAAGNSVGGAMGSGAMGSSTTGSGTTGSDAAGAQAGGSSAGGGGPSCAPASGGADATCGCPPCPTWRTIPIPKSLSASSVFAARSGRVFLALDSVTESSTVQYSDTLDGTWHQSAFPSSGTRRIVSESSDGALVTIAVGGREVCLSQDGGETFSCPKLAASATSGVISWAAKIPQGLFVASPIGALVSPDNGVSFRNLGSASKTVAVDVAAQDGTIYSGSLRYRPGQDRWFDMGLGLSGLIWVGAKGVVFERLPDGLQMSSDLGVTWAPIWDAQPDELAGNEDGSVAARVPNRGVFVHRTGGWAQIGPSKNLTYRGLAVLPDGRVAVLNTNNDLVVTDAPVPADPLVGTEYPASCNDGMLSSGEHAVDCGGSCPPCADWSVFPMLPPQSMVVQTQSGALLSLPRAAGTTYLRSVDDGHNWSEGKLPAAAYSVAAGPGDTVYFESPSNDFYASTDDGETFAKVNTKAVPGQGPLIIAASGTIFVDASGSSPPRSLDGGVTWQTFARPISPGSLCTLASGSLFNGGGSNLRRSADDGVTWQMLAAPPGSASGGFYYPAGATSLCAQRGDYYLSDDDGDSWQLVPAPSTIHPQEALRVTSSGRLVYLSDHVYVSDSKGADWRRAGERGYSNTSGSITLSTSTDGRLLEVGGMPRISTDPASW